MMQMPQQMMMPSAEEQKKMILFSIGNIKVQFSSHE